LRAGSASWLAWWLAREDHQRAAIGWTGAINSGADAARHAAILRSWEDRYDAILVGLGFDGVHLVVRRPPAGEDAVRCAAEQYAFCPDVVDQGAGTLAALAQTLEDLSLWAFWWD